MYKELDNSDKHDTYGGIDPYFLVDAKISYKIKNLTLSIAGDNLTNSLIHMYHPYTRRLIYTELKWEF